MNKKILFFVLILVLSASCFIPVNQQKNVVIKSPFLNLYGQLSNPVKWENWRPDLQKEVLADSTKIKINDKKRGNFTIAFNNSQINATSVGTAINVVEKNGETTSSYGYFLSPVIDKFMNSTQLTVVQKTNLFRYVTGKLGLTAVNDHHIADLKNFMETDSLLYGFKITRIGVPGNNLAVIRKEVTNDQKFVQAAKNLAILQQYIGKRGIHQINPLIAQFLPRGKDSTQVNVGFFIDKEIVADNVVSFVKMPKGGPLYVAYYRGPFNKRQKVYTGLQAYFTDHLYQSAILPFETYLDNKLPTSATDTIKMRLNFTAYF